MVAQDVLICFNWGTGLLLSPDAGTVNREKLARLLKEYVVLGKTDGTINFLSAFQKLGNSQKLEVVLAAAKARTLLFEGIAEGVPPSYIISLQIIPEGSVKTGLKKLLSEYKIKKNKNGYILPTYRIDELADALNVTH